MAKGSENKRIAVYPGSFDPITWGHVDIIHRIHKVFDEVIVLIAQAQRKSYLFDVEERRSLVKACLEDLDRVRVEVFDGLTTDFARKVGATILVRGLRTVSDFDSEIAMAQMNKSLYPEVETLLVFASPEFQAISSHMVKEVASLRGPLRGVVPPPVEKALEKKFKGT